MPVALEHLTVPVNGLRLHVVAAGPADGRPVVLLHGFPEFWRGWLKQMEPLAEAGFRVIVPDQRGYNLSDKPRGVGAYRVPALVADLIGLLDHFGYARVCLAGHDWGAAVAWAAALAQPSRVERLAILNVPHPAVMTRTLLRSPRQLLKSWYIFFFQIPGLPEALLSAGHGVALGNLLRRSGAPGTFTPADLAAYHEAWAQPGAVTAMLNWYRAAVRYGALAGPARRVRVPVLLLWGRRDVALSAEMAPASAALCDDAQLIFFDEATHWVQHDKAEAVTRHLRGFFAP